MSRRLRYPNVPTLGRFILAIMPFLLVPIPAHACPNSKLDHVAVLVESTAKTMASLKSTFGASAFGETMTMSDPGFGQIDLTYVYLSGAWLEFVEPVGPGPMTDLLKKVGSGTIIELNFETKDLLACSKWLAKRDVAMTDVNGNSYGSGTFGSVIEPYGLRFAYVDQSRTNGASVEYYQRSPAERDFLTRRDVWMQNLPKGTGVAFGAVNVEVSDLGTSMRNFERLGFPARIERGFCARRMCRSALVASNSMPIRLYHTSGSRSADGQPIAAGPDAIRSISVAMTRKAHDRLVKGKASAPELVILSGKQAVADIGRNENERIGLKVLIEDK